MPSARMARAHMPQESFTICLTVASTSGGTPLPARENVLFIYMRVQACAPSDMLV